jgi:hypothetical protein
MAIGQRRHARRWIAEHGGVIPEHEAAMAMVPSDYRIPFWRQWLGDETALVIFLREGLSNEEEDWIRTRFPEADIMVVGRN